MPLACAARGVPTCENLAAGETRYLYFPIVTKILGELLGLRMRAYRRDNLSVGLGLTTTPEKHTRDQCSAKGALEGGLLGAVEITGPHAH